MPEEPPVGCLRAFPGASRARARWRDYREVLEYIRTETAPTTFVANALNSFPYEAINGPMGRLSPFLAEAGVCWMLVVDLSLDAEFAEDLVRRPDSVVVWNPRRIGHGADVPLKHIEAVVHEYYEPAASFGSYEVWRRKSGKWRDRSNPNGQNLLAGLLRHRGERTIVPCPCTFSACPQRFHSELRPSAVHISFEAPATLCADDRCDGGWAERDACPFSRRSWSSCGDSEGRFV